MEDLTREVVELRNWLIMAVFFGALLYAVLFWAVEAGKRRARKDMDYLEEWVCDKITEVEVRLGNAELGQRQINGKHMPRHAFDGGPDDATE